MTKLNRSIDRGLNASDRSVEAVAEDHLPRLQSTAASIGRRYGRIA